MLTWELSADDAVAVEPLPDGTGVSGYDIYMGDSFEGLELIATVSAGVGGYLVESVPGPAYPSGSTPSTVRVYHWARL